MVVDEVGLDESGEAVEEGDAVVMVWFLCGGCGVGDVGIVAVAVIIVAAAIAEDDHGGDAGVEAEGAVAADLEAWLRGRGCRRCRRSRRWCWCWCWGCWG